jgi:hypothetical protein
MVHPLIVGCEQSIQSSRDPSIAIGRTGIELWSRVVFSDLIKQRPD